MNSIARRIADERYLDPSKNGIITRAKRSAKIRGYVREAGESRWGFWEYPSAERVRVCRGPRR